MARSTDVEVVRGELLDRPALNERKAREAEERVKQAARAGKQALWDLYEALYDFDQANGWAALGYESLSGWLNDPAIDMTRGSYYRAVMTWKRWVVEGGVRRRQLEGVSATKAALLDDEVAEGTVSASAAIKDIKALTAEALREKYAKPKRGRPSGARSRRKASVRRGGDSDALVAARELPWQLIEGAVDGDGNIDLRRARTRQFLTALLEWRGQYLVG